MVEFGYHGKNFFVMILDSQFVLNRRENLKNVDQFNKFFATNCLRYAPRTRCDHSIDPLD